MTLWGKLRMLVLFWLAMAAAPALGFGQQEQSPSDNQPANQPQAPAPAAPNSPAQTTTPVTASPEQPKTTGQPSNHPATRGSRKTRARKAKNTTTTESGKVVVANGGAKEHENQLAPAMSQEQAVRERENTSQLLATTDANLKSIAGRQLTPAQQNMLAQIHSYVNQSKAASDAGDFVRANTLASKAHLLSDELAKK
jgi:hypothetical protein